MKKIFGPVAAVIGFAALASFVLFVGMSPSALSNAFLFAPSAPTNSPNLTADIGSILSDTAPAANDAIAQQASATPADIPVDQNAAAAQPASDEVTPPTTTSDVVAPTSSDIAPPTDTVAPAVPVPDFPVATATISVTPTAPKPTETSQPLAEIASGTAITLPYDESNFSGDANWQATWGSLQVTGDGYLELSAASNSIGGTAYLKNTQGWTDYAMDSVVDLEGGQSFALIADYADASNYVACEYVKTATDTISVQLVQYVHGYRTPLTNAVPVTSGTAITDLNADIQVQSIYGSCVLDGEFVTNQGIGPGRTPMASSWSGGIGFSVSDPTSGASKLVVKSVSVSVR